MKALIFVCLMFVGCYHEKEKDIDGGAYQFNDLLLTTTDSCIIMDDGTSKMYLRALDSNAIQYALPFHKNLRVTVTFEAYRID